MLRGKHPKLIAKSKSKSKSETKSKSKSKSETKTKGKSEAMYHVGSGSGQEPAKLRREVRDEDEQIRTLGSKAGKPKVSGDRAHMINSSLSLKEVIALMDDLEEKKEQKAVEHSLNELQLEGEEEEEEEDGFELCGICSKENDHWTFECPWLDLVPEGATVGSGYGVVCRDCGQVGGHPGRNWTGRAVTALCCICENIGHWTQDCPKYQPPRVEVLMHEEEYVGPRKVSTAKCGGVMHFEELEDFYD